MKISILTAVYNTVAYLPECFDSIMNQTYRDWQLICIDDASTDGSWELLQEYAAKDSRITLLRNDVNMGQAKARNKGIAFAEGELLTMVDSDDWLASDALERIHDTFAAHPMTDCVLFECRMAYADGRCEPFRNRTDASCLSGDEACLLSIDWGIHGVYAARKALFDRYPYDDIRRTYSDDNTTRLHYLKSREVRLSDGVYFYRQHAASASHAVGISRLDILPALTSLKKMLSDEHLPERYVNRAELMRWRNVMGSYMFYYARRNRMTSQEREYVKNLLSFYYQDTDTRSLPAAMKLRFGYAPVKWCPLLYRVQMLLFTRLRLLLGMDKGRY